MTLFRPTLLVNQLVVTKSGSRVFDQKFHTGVNVLCGENSSGKSTVLDLLFHSLGGNVTTWKTEAGTCDTTLVEICANDSPIVLRRGISPGHQPELEIYWGDMQTADSHSDIGWQKFSYSRTKNLESFSQVLFRVLGFPEVRGQDGANVTMHQLLRVIFADQASPHGSIFRFERFDPALTRQAVGDLLTGIYDEDLYDYQLELTSLEKDFDDVSRRLKTIYQLFGSAEEDVTIEFIAQLIANSEKERDSLYEALQTAKDQKWSDQESGASVPEFVTETYRELRKASEWLHEIQEERDDLEFEISDSADFISVLETRISQLDISSGIQGQLGQMEFFYCPSCLSPLSKPDSPDTCKLCGTEIDKRSARSQFVRMRNEIELQLKESRDLISKSEDRLGDITLQIPELIENRTSLARRYEEVSKNLTSRREAEVEELIRRIGYADAELEAMRKRERLFEQIRELVEEKVRIQGSITKNREIVAAKRASQEKRRQRAYATISDDTAQYLSQDLEREGAFFQRDTTVEFDFSGDKVFIRDKGALSASSMVYLRNAFHLALLTASCKVEDFRYPRLMILDGLDDGGMELERNHNFQRLLVAASDEIQIDHQIVVATSMPAEELIDSDRVLGEFYTHEHKTLAM